MVCIISCFTTEIKTDLKYLLTCLIIAERRTFKGASSSILGPETTPLRRCSLLEDSNRKLSRHPLVNLNPRENNRANLKWKKTCHLTIKNPERRWSTNPQEMSYLSRITLKIKESRQSRAQLKAHSNFLNPNLNCLKPELNQLKLDLRESIDINRNQ